MLIRPSDVCPWQCAQHRNLRRRLARDRRGDLRTLTFVVKIAELPFPCSCYGCKCSSFYERSRLPHPFGPTAARASLILADDYYAGRSTCFRAVSRHVRSSQMWLREKATCFFVFFFLRFLSTTGDRDLIRLAPVADGNRSVGKGHVLQIGEMRGPKVIRK